MRQTLEAQITCAATKAKNLLGQLGPLVWALHARHQCVGDTAEVIADNPSRHVRVGPGIDDDVREQAVGDIGSLIGRASGDKTMYVSARLRDVINRSIVVYAVAVLEEFLDEAAKPIWERRAAGPVVCPRGCRRDPEWPADTLNKIECLRRDMDIDLRSAGKLYINTGWLVLARNAVIHNDGIAPADIAFDAGRYGLDRRWKISKDREENDILVWDECDPVSRRQLAGKRFSIAIDHLVLPRLGDAQAFVLAAGDMLLNADCGVTCPASAPFG